MLEAIGATSDRRYYAAGSVTQPPDDAPPPRPVALVAGGVVVPPSLGGPILAAAVTTAIVTAASYLAPDCYAATLVGVGFLASTWWLVLRHDEATVRAYGLSLGGLLEPARLEPRRLTRDALVASGWALLLALITFPPFVLGYRFFWRTHGHFVLRLPPSLFDEIAGQLVVIALPEEAFFRGYLQTALDRIWPPRWRVFGADWAGLAGRGGHLRPRPRAHHPPPGAARGVLPRARVRLAAPAHGRRGGVGPLPCLVQRLLGDAGARLRAALSYRPNASFTARLVRCALVTMAS